MKTRWMPSAWRVAILGLFVVLVLAVVQGCAGSSEYVSHGYEFDFLSDSREAELLDFRYGASKYGRSAKESLGKISQGGGVFGEIRRGDDLHVQWRLKSTGEVFEDTVDLKHRLPADIERCTIYFMVRGPQLYVYLITPKRRAPDEPRNGPKAYSSLKTLTIYPDALPH